MINPRPQQSRERAALAAVPKTAYHAIDQLEAQASAAYDGRADGTGGAASATAAAGLARDAIHSLESMQLELTSALIASQDRIHAMKALAQINVQGLASEQTIGLLLGKALGLTESVVILLLEGEEVIASNGQLAQLDEYTAVTLESIRLAPGSSLRSAASGRAMIAALDPDGQADRYLAFFRGEGRSFSTTDIPVIEAIVSALGVMLAFNDLHHRELERAAVEREHQLASALAQSVIIERPPKSPVIDFFAKSVPASLTGGDFYVFGQTDGSIWFAVGDVAGKGLPAAMIMTRAVAACRVAFLAHRHASVAEVMRRIEDELFDYLDDVGVFVTLAVGLYDENSHEVSLANAGHSPVVLVRDGVATFVPASVPPLGVVRNLIPVVSSMILNDTDCLVVGSDGLAEQSNASGEMFGYERFRQLCLSASLKPSRMMGEELFDTIHSFAAGQSASDDSTLVILKSLGEHS
ncbi:serine/threonine-protein phosphatase [Subtercola sp. PAMC28395]|uniref:PP2C family protein-serine/threonine phosphatase n=1 Tax=Subtercola sp. PAMC28395 TaxID=2846775 RepID=UPI001C0C7036|nr:PP2C family protein-serine/threonine phosphatase [Subtercola sp. PAMC28395]QWT24315.1 serine/threonine-protein phosphatase [Subtercola sp. PAMC28395]